MDRELVLGQYVAVVRPDSPGRTRRKKEGTGGYQLVYSVKQQSDLGIGRQHE